MNYNMLTNKEILRIAEPETELEKRLMTLVEDMDNNGNIMNEELSDEVGNLEDSVRELESEKSGLDDDISDLESDVERLEKLLDDNNIEHDEVMA